MSGTITIIFILLQIIHFSGKVHGQYFEPDFRNYGSKEGLPSIETYYSFRDSHDMLWICTDNSGSQFDGDVFRNYGQADGLCSNVLFSGTIVRMTIPKLY